VARWFRLRFGFPVARSFVCECPSIPAMLRFHISLIKPDVRFSRIRLSDEDSRVRPRKATGLASQLEKTQLLVQVRVREA